MSTVIKRAGIKDVAMMADVSIATVSAVLNGKELHRFPEATQERVRRAAQTLEYQPNGLARGLRTTQTGIIGMVSDLIATTPYAMQMIHGAQSAAAESGHVLMLVNTGRDPQAQSHATSALLGYQVRGIVYAAMARRVMDASAIASSVPVVLANESDDVGRFDSVVSNDREASTTAVQNLISAGHRKIVHLTYKTDLLGPSLRRQGFMDAIRAAGLPIDRGSVVEAADFTAPAAREASLSFLEDPQRRPTAVFCVSDQLAMGVYQAASRLALSIPSDVSVMGFGGWRLISDELDPPLTTMAVPYFELGEWAVRRLTTARDPRGSSITHEIAASLRAGGSVAPPLP